MMTDLPLTFASREQLAKLLHELFPLADGELSPIRGGRREAERLLAAIDPLRYGTSRNHLDGAVTRLSPVLRHGVLTLAEVRDAVFARVAEQRQGAKLISELGWRDYWQRLWRQWGDGIWRDREPLGTGHPPGSYQPRLPADIAEGRTGLACIDAFVADLVRIGWLHNHARLWLASYVVHWRQVRWQAGARWFLRHLLDGDPASNNLSWQWVASSFGSKPYIFNRDNLERFSSSRHCRSCPKAARGGARRPGGCPFEASYEELQQQLFRLPGPAGSGADPAAAGERPATTGAQENRPAPLPPPQRPILWIHGEALGPANPALRNHPDRPALFVFDQALVSGGTTTSGGTAGDPSPLSLKRLGFLYECLLELPVTIRLGDVATELIAFAGRHGADGIVTSRGVDPRFSRILSCLETVLPVQVLPPEPFVTLPVEARPFDLKRFSRYWRRAEPLVWRLRQVSAERPGGRPEP